MFAWIYDHIINTLYFAYGIIALLFLVFIVGLIISYKHDDETNKG